MSVDRLPSGPARHVPSLLVAEGVAVGRPGGAGRPVVEGVDWQVVSGEFWVVLGGPGSGKTDLLFTLAGLQPPLAGRLRVGGESEGGGWGDGRTGVGRLAGLVFENGGRLFHRLTVRENVALALAYHRNCSLAEAATDAEGVLGAVGLGEWAHVTPGRLRPALRQRVALARALALQPRLLLLDDPVPGQDRAELEWWRERLGTWCRGGGSGSGEGRAVVVACPEGGGWAGAAGRFARIWEGRWEVLERGRASREGLAVGDRAG